VDEGHYEPKRPTLVAAGVVALWPALLALPMLAGMWLASPLSDQYNASIPFQAWSAEWLKRAGHLPLWNPEIFGGLPFVAAGSGDIFYPTWLLRLIVPATTAGNFSFFVHYILAGLFTYLLLRRLHVSWTGSVVGGVAYELSGLIASYPSPGHDGKLFASTALPLMLLGLVLALRDRRWQGYPLVATATALTLLGHFQLAYYSLIVAGLFALYLTFEEAGQSRAGERVLRLGLALVAVLLGFGVAAIQILPFFEYIPFSPRAQGYHGFAGSTSYAIPWNHVPEFFLKNFVGARETYWGSNPLKLHSEYLGLPVVGLAVLGATLRERRRQILWLGGIGLLFLLISLGAATPFYRLWWAVMPLVQKTRAPGMAFYVVALVTAMFAGLGVQRALEPDTRRFMTPALVVGAVVALLAAVGTFGRVAETLAGNAAAAGADQSAILWGALSSGLALAATGAVLGVGRARLTPRLTALALALIVATDLWLNARQFWSYVKPVARDQLIDRLSTTPLPYRVLNLPGQGRVYPGSTLMLFGIPEVFGYHGNELRYFDELWDRDNGWRNIGILPLWDLWAVRYAILPAGPRMLDSIPGFRRVGDSLPTFDGSRANLFERVTPAPYARVVPAAVQADSATIIPTLVDSRMDYSRLVLFTKDQPVMPAPISRMPAPSPAHATVTAWQPGRITVALDPVPSQPSYLLIAENWFPDWQATVDGQPATVLRGDYALITLELPAGARTVDLMFRSKLYERGKTLTLGSLALLVLALLAAAVPRRAGHG
jgi:Bacterial membrane protein YfhO